MIQESNTISIIETAIRREIEAYEFYRAVADKTTDAAVKEIFATLAQEEQAHREFLRNCLDDTNILKKLPVPPDYKVAEAAAEPDLSPSMKPAEAIALAMKKEQSSYELYTRLAEHAADPAYKEIFAGLAKMELQHKTQLEDLYVNIGYPEVF